MRFSEAIRLGAMLKPQAFGETFTGTRTCAIGAAKDAVGALMSLFSSVAREYGWPTEKELKELVCPTCRLAWPNRKTPGVIAHLNDDHRWTREQIADWVESIEAPPAVAAVDPPVGVTTE